ncbi:MAG: PilC/PilY family type IV pilus protein [Pseudomonadota bacterium]
MNWKIVRRIFLPIFIATLCLGLALLSLRTQASLIKHISIQAEDYFYNKPIGATAISIAAQAIKGTGAVYQSTYTASHTDAQNNTATWIGALHALFIDSIGNLREDGNGDGILQDSNYSIDPAVRIFFDETDHQAKIARFKFKASPNTSTSAATEIKSISDLNPLWDASKRLSDLSDVTTQRDYSAKADIGRHIFTYLDLNGDGIADISEVKDFVPKNFGAGSYGILNVADADSANTLVNYIRGDESENVRLGMRNRTLDYDNNGTFEVMRLGDIVNSSPTEVGTPAEAFDLLYNDTSYGKFREKYSRRRNMVYVGANDGMIHAFNAGFYNPQTQSYELTGSKSETQHPLGSEIWAYIPYNLLPHLHWLQSKSYGHAWYMDGKPRIFDARIFTDDETHPDGWGTVMAIGMRLGGAPISLDVASYSKGFSDFKSNGAPIAALTLRSAYVLMDITDPEQQPTLIAELTDPTDNIGFTTSYPSVAAFRSSGNENDQWYLIFGSGPALSTTERSFTATTNRSAKLYVYDLSRKAFVTSGTDRYLYDLGAQQQTGAADSFVGDPVTVDWNLDFRADALYFGTIGSSEDKPSGKLFKLDFNSKVTSARKTQNPNDWSAPTVLVNPDNPIVAAPSVTRDEQGHRWVMAGTGRYFTEADKDSRKTQSLFAVIDTLPTTAPSYKNLIDVSDAKVMASGEIQGIVGATTQSALINLAITSNGWKRSLKQSKDAPAERVINRSALLGDTLFVSSFVPCLAPCTTQAKSYLYCLNYKTGMPSFDSAACGKPEETSNSTTSSSVTDNASLGTGTSAAPSLYSNGTNKERDNTLSVITQTSTGAITHFQIKPNAKTRNGEIDWLEANK